MPSLPIDAELPAILTALRESGSLVLVAPPGAGKTTRLAPALLCGANRRGRILLVQPRRLAAVAAADRMAEESGRPLGDLVGYQVRFDQRRSGATRILAITDGMLIRILQDDPFLDGVDAVLLDEFHERRLAGDVALGLLQEARASGRDDLLVAALSASMDPAPVSRALGNAPVIELSDRSHPVEVRHAPRTTAADPSAAGVAVRSLFLETRGHLLIFLPGQREIRALDAELQPFARRHGARLLPLHGRLPLAAQRRAVQPSAERKILLATNVAETSLTVDGVEGVVDLGFARVSIHDARLGIDRLLTMPISKAAALQRSGRAGRQGPGIAVRLWTVEEHRLRPEAEVPEVKRSDLAEAILRLRATGVSDPTSFAWLTPPDAAALARADALLRELGALSADGPLTAIGRRMAEISAHPRIARVLVAADEAGCRGAMAGQVALLEERDVLPLDARPPSAASDLLVRSDLLEGRSPHKLDPAIVRSVRRLARLHAGGARLDAAAAEATLRRCWLAGFSDRLCRRRRSGDRRARMVGGAGVELAPRSAVRDTELFLALSLRATDRRRDGQRLVELACAVEAEWLAAQFPDDLHTRLETRYDPVERAVIGALTRTFRDLPLGDPQRVPPEPDAAARLLVAALASDREAIVAERRELQDWIARVATVAEWAPGSGVEPIDPPRFAAALAPACVGETRLAAVLRKDLLPLLSSALAYPQQRIVEEWAPSHWTAPSGRRIALRYAAGRAPVLSVRLQELFGCHETPCVARGRIPMLIELLGPNHRPVQTTADLHSFWTNTYAQVRKDLRGRYPKHHWPEDPWTAEARRRR